MRRPCEKLFPSRFVVSSRATVVAAVALLSVGLLGAGCAVKTVKPKFQPKGDVNRFSDELWRDVLSAVATPDGYVRYAVLTQNRDGIRDKLFRYVGLLGAVSPENRPELFAGDTDRLAYWINAYNALAMYGVYQRGLPGNTLAGIPPGALYLTDRFRVGGKSYSLDSIEKQHVRSAGDPRIHFAVNCMSRSCPPLRQEPYAGDRLDAQLSEQGWIYLSDPRAVRRDGEKVKLNSIFTNYYKGDFIDAYRRKSGDKDAGLIEAIRPLAAPDSLVQSATGYSSMGYDWSLNRAK